MPSLEYFLVAESMAVDQYSNRLSLFNILEEIHCSSLPLRMTAVAVTMWNIDADDQGKDFQASLTVHSPSGSEPKRFDGNFTPSGKRHRILQHFTSLHFDTAGQYRFELELNGKHVANHLVDVASD